MNIYFYELRGGGGLTSLEIRAIYLEMSAPSAELHEYLEMIKSVYICHNNSKIITKNSAARTVYLNNMTDLIRPEHPNCSTYILDESGTVCEGVKVICIRQR